MGGLALFMFVIIGCGVACANGAGDAPSRLLVAFAFGFGILVLAYAFAHQSGAQINCAVTFALVLAGEKNWKQGLVNFCTQTLGGILGACFLAIIFPCDVDRTQSLGTNVANPAYGLHAILLGEIFGTFLLCHTVFETAVSTAGSANTKNNFGIAIGLSVFLAHVILLPLDGCSINPTRSIGPAIIGSIVNCDGGPGSQGLEDLWLMIVGPMVGAAIAAGLRKLLKRP